MRKPSLLILLLVLTYTAAQAQIGGEYTYDFLNLTNSARMAALGGNQIAINDSEDLNVSYNNPSLLKPDMRNQLAINYVDYFAGINYGYASYSFGLPLPGNFAAGIHYINYGKFTEALETGEKTGSTFGAAEYALNLIWSNSYNQFTYGINLKPILSTMENYQSFGLAADLGITYFSKNQGTTVALVARNVGTQLKTYYEGAEKESIPFDLQFGVSQQLQHAPIRIAATLQHLQKWNLAKAQKDDSGTTTVYTEDSFAKKLMRHVVLGVELLPTANFTIRAGYNYQLRQEMKLDEKMSTVGFSWGFGFRIKRFQINYGSARYHLAGSSNLISVAINLNEGLRRN
jgi:opacity protein-like surface antigen